MFASRAHYRISLLSNPVTMQVETYLPAARDIFFHVTCVFSFTLEFYCLFPVKKKKTERYNDEQDSSFLKWRVLSTVCFDQEDSWYYPYLPMLFLLKHRMYNTVNYFYRLPGKVKHISLVSSPNGQVQSFSSLISFNNSCRDPKIRDPKPNSFWHNLNVPR